MAGPDPPRDDRERRAGPHGRGGLAARRHLQPGDLREGDPRLARLRRGHRGGGAGRALRARGLPPPGGARRAARGRRAAPRLRQHGRPRRLRLARGRAAARARHGGHARAGALVLGPGRPPQPDDQDPRHAGGDPGDRDGPVRGHERQRHAAVRRLGLRGRDGGLPPGDGAPPRRGAAARPPLRRLVLRLARRHRGRQAAGRGRARGPAGPRGPGQRARRLRRLPARVRRRRLRRAARRRVPGPAPAVGLDRGQEPRLSGHALRLRAGRARHREHDAAADAAGRRGRGRGHGRDRRCGPHARPRGARRRRHRPRRRDREAAARRDRGVRRPDEQADRRDRGQARGDRHRPPRVVRGRPAARPRAARRRPRARGRRAGRRAPRVAQGRHAVGAGRDIRARGPARLADDRRQAARGPAGDQGVRRRRARGRADGRGPARHGRVEPRPRGLPPLQPARGRRAAAARARLDRAAPGQGGRRPHRPGDDAVHRLLQVGPDARAERAPGLLPRPPARPFALRGHHRPGHAAAGAGRARGLPPRVLRRPRDRRPVLGALAVRHRAGGAGRRRRRHGARGRPGGGGELPAAGGQLRAVARRGARRARAAAAATS